MAVDSIAFLVGGEDGDFGGDKKNTADCHDRRPSANNFAIAETNFSICDRELERVFRIVDEQNAGNINLAQFDVCLREFGIAWQPKQLRSVFQALDTDKDKRLTLNEYLGFVCRCPEILELKDAFSLFETNEDGLICWEEFRHVMDTLTNHNHSEAEIRDMFDLADKEHRQQISVMEFAKIINKYPAPVTTSELFALFDKENNGYVNREQLAVACRELNLMFTDLEVEEMFLEADADNDGRITFDDLCNVWGVLNSQSRQSTNQKPTRDRSRFTEARSAATKPKKQPLIKRVFGRLLFGQ